MKTRILLLCLGIVSTAAADSPWHQWRGPNRDGKSAETGLLTRWPSAGPKLAWKASGLGAGYASVVVGDGRVYTIGKDKSNTVWATALSEKNGDIVWRKKIGSTGRTPLSTPTFHQGRLYTLDPDGKLYDLDARNGDTRWMRSLQKEFGARLQNGRGHAESPLIDGDRVICTPGTPKAVLTALDRKTGKVIWNCPMPKFGNLSTVGAGFSSIVKSSGGGVSQYVQFVGRGVVGVSTAGKFLWGYDRIAKAPANIPTPVVNGDYVFCANGYGNGSALLKLSADGPGKVKAEEVYFLNGGRFQNHHGGMILLGKHLFAGHGSNNGLPTCIDFASGKIKWKRRGPGTGSAAILYADKHLYFRYQNGVMALIQANPKRYRLRGKFRIPTAGTDSWAHPVISGGKLYLREKDRLFVYNIKKS